MARTASPSTRFCGETVVGVVYAPYLDELYTATLGGGARAGRMEGTQHPIRVAEKRVLGEAVLATGFPYDKVTNPDNNADNLARILPRTRGIRRYGSAAYDLCCVAAGFLDGYWELALHVWDVCAGELIVREAGGAVRSLREDRGVSIVAGNETLIGEMLQYVR